MSAFKQNNESKREEFRKYLEKTGLMEKLTKALVCLFEEQDRPQDPIEYICAKLATNPDASENKDATTVQDETIDKYKAQVEKLEAELAALKKIAAPAEKTEM